MSNDKQKTRAKLLSELESIKDLLQEEELQDFEPPLLTSTVDAIEDAPLLTEVLEEDPTIPDEEAIPILEEAVELPTAEPPPVEAKTEPADKAKSELKPQQPEEPEPAAPDTASAAAKLKPSAPGENPFLPKHIRDRLAANRKNQTAMMEALAPIAKPASAAKPAAPSDQQLIDEMVQRFLPAIESALRERLQEVLRKERKSEDDGQEN